MPTILRTGFDFEKDGETITPRREVHLCDGEGCTAEAIYGVDVPLCADSYMAGKWSMGIDRAIGCRGVYRHCHFYDLSWQPCLRLRPESTE